MKCRIDETVEIMCGKIKTVLTPNTNNSCNFLQESACQVCPAFLVPSLTWTRQWKGKMCFSVCLSGYMFVFLCICLHKSASFIWYGLLKDSIFSLYLEQ